ncbi:MAG: rRNA maturation RNase YbeY [Planctomycetota bacterium]
MIHIDIANRQTRRSLALRRLRTAIRQVLADAHCDQAAISVAIVDDPTIHQLNVRFLQHDYPTDVLSFLLSDPSQPIEGEIIVSADTAARAAREYGWQLADELLLYVIHGTLHLVGYDDHQPRDLARMRRQERRHLQSFGLQPRY